MKKRQLTNQQKMQIVLESMRGKTSIAEWCSPDIFAGSRQIKGSSEM